MKSLPDFWFEPHLWVNGEWVRAVESLDIRNPATGNVIARVSMADPILLDRAVHGAARAQKEWGESSPFERGEILKRVASLLSARKDPFARLLTSEQGKPYPQSVAEVEYAASFFQWFGEEARRVHGRITPHPDRKREYLIEQRPIGVAGLITPWNFPLAQGAKKIAASLAAGCAAVWKPAELTPLIALAMAPLLQEAGLPRGVLQIVPGIGSQLGKPLAEHPDIRILSLTGSTRTGATLLSYAATGIKRVTLELGGNAPFIVLPDADLDLTAEQLVKLKLFVSGQVCVTANRVFVHREQEKELLDRLATRMASVRAGDGLEDGIDAGPLIHHKACQGVGELVADALAQGAKLSVENRSFETRSEWTRGSFFPPTVLSGVSDSMRIAREEIFGPVIPILTYTDPQEAILRANATPYGLAAYVYGSNISMCREVARQLEVGIVGVNEWRPLRAEIPFGGVKQSGFGAEGGLEGIQEFLNPQVISIPRFEL
ncbi:MAG: NAD-dependent succinate-semialdehyde dehydrogenase [Planctomycetes bacterium]|nr:NAD-dependent succinate-semialdehyde dehydrogenase [Planctomycetota bacterium]